MRVSSAVEGGRVTILDGPMGTELLARGVLTPLPGWSAHALENAPAVVRSIHGDYAAAGAVVHTANTFRTKNRQFPDRWKELARRAVQLCRESVPRGHLVAGSIAPLEDCYRPDLSPPADEARREHGELARVLAEAGCDLLLCETFPHVGEALIAVEVAAATGVEAWASFTSGPKCDLLTPQEIAIGAAEAVKRGARAVLVNCCPATRIRDFIEPLAGTGVPVGAYANAGEPDVRMGWRSIIDDPAQYADLAETWLAAGATIVGSCCGTGPGHIAELARRLAADAKA